MGHSRNSMDLPNPSDGARISRVSGSSVSKGGRKPIYSTSEERKVRNRQAQAAFRERRTEHIKELEELVELQKVEFQRLQMAHAQATDECLMLRYKNSLLERILLEKGIDVQAELYVRRDTSYLDPMEGVSTFRRPPVHHSVRTSVIQPLQIVPQVGQSSEGKLNCPPSLATSPHSSIDESHFVPKTPTSSPMTATPSSRASHAEPENTTSQSNEAETAAANILKRLKGSKTGSMRNTAAYFLSSFLEHIESLGKLPPPL